MTKELTLSRPAVWLILLASFSSITVSQQPPTTKAAPDFTGTHGRVLDGDGNPLAGAKVRAWGSGTPRNATKTDSDGRFTLHGLTAGMHFNIRIELVGYQSVDLRDLEAIPEVFSFVLLPGITVRGWVIDTAGEPLEGVRVFGSAHNTAWNLTAVSNADGYFVLESLPAGTLRLRAFTDGGWAEEQRIPLWTGDDTEVTIVVKPAVELAGWVLGPQWETVAGAVVKVTDHSSGKAKHYLWQRTAEDGSFFSPRIPPGTYQVSVEHPDFEPVAVPLILNDESVLDLRLQVLREKPEEEPVFAEGVVGEPPSTARLGPVNAWRLLGQVRLDGHPLPNAFILMACHDSGWATVRAKSGPEGRFSFPHIRECRGGDLSVHGGGTVFATYEIQLIEDTELTLDLEGGLLSGMVHDDGGEPLANVELALFAMSMPSQAAWQQPWPGQWPNATVTSDADGRFAFPRITQTIWLLRASHSEFEDRYEWIDVTTPFQEEAVVLQRRAEK